MAEDAVSKKRVAAIQLAMLLTIVLVCLGVVWFLCPMLNDPFNDARFDRAVWIAASETKQIKSPRGPMAEDLQSRVLHKGMMRRQVESVIGKPDQPYQLDHSVEIYYLGSWGWMATDPAELRVFYRQGRLVRTRIEPG